MIPRHSITDTIETAIARCTVRSGTHSRSTVIGRAWDGSFQPFAYPSTSVEPPTSRPLTVAFHPAFWLWPSTSHDAWFDGATSTSTLARPERRTCTDGLAPPDRTATVPFGVRRGSIRPPARLDQTIRSTSSPVCAPAPLRTSWRPASRCTTSRFRVRRSHDVTLTGWSATAAAVVPDSWTGNGEPSIVNTSVRHVVGSCAG